MWTSKVKLEGKAWSYFCKGSLLSVLVFCNSPFLMSLFRRPAEGGLHHPRTRRRGTHDRGNAHEEHNQSGEERSSISPREDPHGGCVLMCWKKAPHSTPSNNNNNNNAAAFAFVTWSNRMSSPCTWTGKMIAFWLSCYLNFPNFKF